MIPPLKDALFWWLMALIVIVLLMVAIHRA